MTILISGFSSAFKVPIFAGETVYGAGAVSQGSIPLILLLVGLKSSSGSMTVDTSILDVFSEDDADDYAGPGSELARMCYAALRIPGVRIKIATPTGAGGAAATATITITGPATSAGELVYRIGGDVVTVQIASGDNATAIGEAIEAAIQAKPRLAVSANNVAGVVTLTVKHPGIRGNQYILHQVTTGIATGVASALAGGAAVTGGGVFFTGGTGTEDATALVASLFAGWYHRIAVAQNDATNLGRWKTTINAKAGPLEGRTQHVCVATNGALSGATSLSTATLNDPRFQNLWLLYSESHPSELAAAMAALRTATEQDDPDAAYDGSVLLGVAPQVFETDWAQMSTQQSALDNGVTPLVTTTDGSVAVARSITTRCLSGTNPDYGTLDTSDGVVPDYVRDGLRLIWTDEFKPSNPRVAADPADGQRDRPAGVATPTRWNQRALKYLRDLEQASPPILIDVDLYPPVSEYNAAAKRIMSVVPVKPAPNQHQIGVSVRQQAA